MKSPNAEAEEGLFFAMRQRLETRVALGALGGLGVVWVILGVMELARPGFLGRMDVALLRALRQGPEMEHVIGPGAVEHAVLQLTSMGGSSVVIVWVALLMGFFVLTQRARYAVLLGFATAGGAALGYTAKYLVQRARPQVVPHLMAETSWSFPSGHATITMVVFMTLAMLLANYCQGRWAKLYVMAAALGLVVLVGATRLAMGVHYPTDVLGGWTLGLSWALVVWMVGYALDAGALQRIGIAGK